MKSYTTFVTEASTTDYRKMSIEDVDAAITSAIEDKWLPKTDYTGYTERFKRIVYGEKEDRFQAFSNDRKSVKGLEYDSNTPEAQAFNNLYYDAVSVESPRDIISLGKKLAAAKKSGIGNTSFYKIIEDTYNKYKGVAEKLIAAKAHLKTASDVRQKAKDEEKEKETKKFQGSTMSATDRASKGQSLIEVLYKETKVLKDEFLQKTADWARKDFAKAVEMTKWSKEQWMQKYGESSYSRGGKYLSQKGYTIQEQVHRIVHDGLTTYLTMETKRAEEHYNNSIIKLAHKVVDKGLDPGNITAHTSKIGVNIDTTITDGHKTVRAFTIIASGEIQRPHYRYLIK